jgi:uroporphyrinogen-III synthase
MVSNVPSTTPDPIRGVLIARPRDAANAMVAALTLRQIPATALAATTVSGITAETWPDATPDALIFLSRAAVAFGQPVLNRYPHTPIIAIGTGTAAKLREHGRVVQYQPAHASSEGVLSLLAELPALQHIGLVCGRGGRDWLASVWQARQLPLTRFEVYERQRAQVDTSVLQPIRHAIQTQALKILTATSVQLLTDALALVNTDSVRLQSLALVSLSPRISEQAKALGFLDITTVNQADDAHLIATLALTWQRYASR